MGKFMLAVLAAVLLNALSQASNSQQESGAVVIDTENVVQPEGSVPVRVQGSNETVDTNYGGLVQGGTSTPSVSESIRGRNWRRNNRRRHMRRRNNQRRVTERNGIQLESGTGSDIMQQDDAAVVEETWRARAKVLQERAKKRRKMHKGKKYHRRTKANRGGHIGPQPGGSYDSFTHSMGNGSHHMRHGQPHHQHQGHGKMRHHRRFRPTDGPDALQPITVDTGSVNVREQKENFEGVRDTPIKPEDQMVIAFMNES